METWGCRMGGPTPTCGGKNWEGYLRIEGSQRHTRSPSSGFQHQKDKSPKLLAVKTNGGWGGRRNCGILKSLVLKGSQWTLDLCRLTPSGLQHQGNNSWKGTSNMWGEIEVSGIRACARRKLPPDRTPEARQWHCPLSKPSPHTATEQCHRLPCCGNYLRLYPIQLTSVLFYNRPHY